MQPRDLNAVVRLHLRSFGGFFLSFLGPRFLKLLYGEILKRPDHVALAARHPDGRLAGFVAGVAHQGSFYGEVARRRWFAFAVAAFPAAIRNPRIVPRLMRSLRHPGRARDAASQALLMSVAVDPDLSGRGIGRLLVSGFLKAMREKGVRTVSLTTDRDANDRVNAFYRDLGFRLARSYATAEGRWMNEYTKDATV